MKTRDILLLAIVAILAVSCDLEGDSNFTPSIFFIHHPVNQAGDSLHSYYTDQAGVFLMDTISEGDTILFSLYMDAYANQLTGFYLKQSADSVTRILLPDIASMDTIFTTESDYAQGRFLMDGTNSVLRFPFRYVALKSSHEARLEFVVVSNAIFNIGMGSNINSFRLKTPIKKLQSPLEE
jgi:hypothetical protein